MREQMERDPTTLSVGAPQAPRVQIRVLAERLWTLARSDDPVIWWSVLGVMLLAGAALFYYETRDTTFWVDEWTWALTRRGGSLGTFLDAHNGHLSLVPVAIYKLLFATAGLRHYGPYRIAVILAQLGCTTLLFVYARRRVGGFLATVAAAALLFFGPGWQDFLWPFQLAWLISLGTGVAAFLMLDRGDALGRGAACALTAVSLASSGIGVAVALGVLADALFGSPRWRYWWVAGGPLAVYLLWSIGYQDTTVTIHGFEVAPDFAFNAAASSLGAVLGFGGGVVPALPASGANMQDWGQPLAILVLLLFLWRIPRLGRSPARIFALLVAGASFWFLTGLTRWFISAPYESRYLYVGALVVLLLMVELAAGLRINWVANAVIGVLAIVALITNIGDLRAGAGFLRSSAQVTRAQIGGLNIARPFVPAGFATGPFGIIRAGQYFAAKRAIGAPAATPAQIATFAESARDIADAELQAIEDIRLLPVRTAGRGSPPPVDAATAGATITRGSCTSFTPAPFASSRTASALSVTVPTAGLVLRTGPVGAAVAYRRFGVTFQPLGTVAPGAQMELRIRPDLASQPWHLQISSSASFSVCGLTG
jgi:hypothetical protein